MSTIFEGDCDSDENIKINNEYAKKYDSWRKKEELNKLKTKYGEDGDLYEASSSSSDEDEDGVELTDKIERDFYKTLACLKNKDPRIYDESVKFFDDRIEGTSVLNKSKKKEEPVFLKDYERKLILEKGGVLSDEEENIAVDDRPRSPTYIEEQKRIKDSFKHALNSIEDDEAEDEEWGGLFKERKKTKEEKEKEEVDYKRWLAGQRNKIEDKEVEKQLKPLKDYWNKPDLDPGEKFLRDYILNKKFLDNDDEDYIPTYDEIIHDSDNLSNDEEIIEEQEEFEHKYNFRFEEPDQDFIKRYPRTLENSVRRKDDRRKVKRQETKERKKKEKEEKMQDLKKLQELKRKEIEEKLEKLKEITGNTNLGFADEDVDGDFDPEAHDKRMQALFSEDYYQGPEGDQKPEFPDLDEELEIENWDRFDGENEPENESTSGPHCEEDDFIMDCDYNPQAVQNESVEKSRGKKRKRKSKFAEALSKPKPKFDPNDKNYEKYFDEYYKLDCEDIIGDIPCRFKYREVVPNDFGLSVEEILLAKDKELNKWCSLKKAVQIRPDHIEKYDQIAYQKKSKNSDLKRRVLPSLFTAETEEKSTLSKMGNTSTSITEENKTLTTAMQNDIEAGAGSSTNILNEPNGNSEENNKSGKKQKRKKNENPTAHNKETVLEETKGTIKTDEVNPLRKEYGNKKPIDVSSGKTNNGHINNKRKRKRSETQNGKTEVIPRKRRQKLKKKHSQSANSANNISDARLAAYGINPKKYKNKLKYGNK